MKRYFLQLVMLILFHGIGPSAYCAGTQGIQGTAHDFTFMPFSSGEICKACHAPHGADGSVLEAPLWNHTLTQQIFVPYQSNTLKAVVGQPDGESKLCLSCHDGTVALDSFGGADPSLQVYKIGDSFGPNLLMDHPINHPLSFVFDSQLVADKGGLIDPNQPQTVLGGNTIRDQLLFPRKDLSRPGKFQCTSCHDVHSTKGFENLLRMPDDALCKTCHTTPM